VEDVDASGKGEEVGKECKRKNMVKHLVHMKVNGKKIPDETVS
jgi:hypothetical protein